MLTITDSAAAQLRDEIGSRVLRIAFTTGCGGSGYRLSFEQEPMTDDTVLEQDGVRIALDDMAARKLDGAVIDVNEDEGYLLDHPDAVMAIWCG